MQKRGDVVDDIKAIYKILKGISKSMDYDEFDATFLEVLKITPERKNKLIQILIEDDLISGFAKIEHYNGYSFQAIDPRLTLKGIDFLENNSMMKKVKETIKDIGTII